MGALNAGGVGNIWLYRMLWTLRRPAAVNTIVSRYLAIDRCLLELVLSTDVRPSSGVSQSRCKSVYGTESHAPVNMPTCPLSYNPSPAFQVAATSDQLTAVTWTSVMSDWLHTANVHLVTPAHQTGTHFLPTSETTMVFPCQLSNAILRLFSSLSVSTRSSFWVLLQKRTV